MPEIHLITVGKLKDKNILALESEYLKRLSDFNFKIHEVKTFEEDLHKEGKEVLSKLNDLRKKSTLHPILLMENGQEFSSSEFSNWIYKKLETLSRLALIIGGASGHGPEVLEMVKDRISLGKMTFPHQMARLLLIEQIYRIQTIKNKHPYHK
jgi:23S rRNA (pseudouridine1915-N3)-methyltransferase